jgi:hypothetical protein
MGVTREVASLMQAPQGDFVCLFHEFHDAEDIAEAVALLATSDDPYDQRFRSGRPPIWQQYSIRGSAS